LGLADSHTLFTFDLSYGRFDSAGLWTNEPDFDAEFDYIRTYLVDKGKDSDEDSDSFSDNSDYSDEQYRIAYINTQTGQTTLSTVQISLQHALFEIDLIPLG